MPTFGQRGAWPEAPPGCGIRRVAGRPARRIRVAAGLLLLCGAAVLGQARPAAAQAIDQTALEQLFGEPVTTSVTGEPQRVSQVPTEMVIFTADDIRRSGAQTIPEVLRFVPGLDVRSYGVLDSAVGIQGDNTALNPRVLVLLDGKQVYQDDYGFTAWSLIPVTLGEIRQIEIIKGPNAALYGFNAVDGVINIVTYDPLHDKLNRLGVAGGSQSETAGSAVATAQIAGRLGVRLSAQGFRATEFPGREGYDGREQPHGGMLGIDARLQVTPRIEWDVTASISSLDSEFYADTGLYLPLGLKANSVRSRLSDDTAIGVLQLDAYRNENRSTSDSPLDPFAWREDVTVAQASDLLKVGNHTLRFAGEYRDNTISSHEAFNGRLGYTNFAGSLMWDWRILRWLSLTNAVREDDLSLNHRGPQFEAPGIGGVYHSARIAEASFNSGAVIRLSADDTIRVTAARAVQLPSLVDFGFTHETQASVIAGNSSLAPAALLNYGLDYDRALPGLGSIVRVALFTQHTDNSIGSPFGSGIDVLPTRATVLEARNFAGSSQIGGEIGIKGSSAGLRWNASYTLATVDDHSPRALLLQAPSISYQRATPTQSIILGGGYTWGRFELDGEARWQSHYDDFSLNPFTASFREVAVSNYVTINAKLAYHLTRQITVAVVAQQLNQHSIVETAGVPTGRRLVASIGARF